MSKIIWEIQLSAVSSFFLSIFMVMVIVVVKIEDDELSWVELSWADIRWWTNLTYYHLIIDHGDWREWMNEDLLAVEKMENKIFYNDIGIFFLHWTLDHETFIISDGTSCIHPMICNPMSTFQVSVICMYVWFLISHTPHTYISMVPIY